MNRRRRATAVTILWAAASIFGAATHAADANTVPLCAGLTVVTAISQRDGDYESIKTIEAVGAADLRLRYSAETKNTGLFASGPPVKKVVVRRTVLAADTKDARIYEQVFLEKSAEIIPGSTAIGVSAAVLDALKSQGQAELTLSNAYAGLELTADRNVRPNYYDYLRPGKLKRIGRVDFPVLVNDQPVKLPAIHATGEFVGEKAEFFFLDDPKNPLALAFRLGIDAVKPLNDAERSFCDTLRKAGAEAETLSTMRCDRPEGGDRDTLRVTKITYRCSAPPLAAGGGGGGEASLPGTGTGAAAPAGAGGADAMEQALAKTGKVDVYSIYFSFDSDAVREESEPTLRDIAEVLKRHPDWKLRVNGHTDSIGDDAYNLALSKRRSAAVKDALVKRYKQDPARLTSDGMGESRPRDTNDTLEGRARNRRVELMRQ